MTSGVTVGVIDNVQIWHPGAADGRSDEYWADGEGGMLASMYGELLGMRRVDVGYIKLVHDDGSRPEIGLENGPDDVRAQWPDPERPQQLHLDIEVGDLDAAEQIALRFGASLLRDGGQFRVYADAVGHPFCLYAEPSSTADAVGRLARVVFDCFSPRALARFYAEVLGMHALVVDTPGRVVIAGGGDVMLAFQHAQFPGARWPDPNYPAQLHLDVAFDEPAAGRRLVERLGAMLLEAKPSHAVYADPASHPFCIS